MSIPTGGNVAHAAIRHMLYHGSQSGLAITTTKKIAIVRAIPENPLISLRAISVSDSRRVAPKQTG